MTSPGNLHCISCICTLPFRSGTDSPGGVCVSQPPTNTTASQQFSAQLNLLVSYVQYVRQSARQSVHYQHCFIQHFTSKTHWVSPLPLLHPIPHATPSFLSLPFPIPHPFPLLPQN